MITIPLTFFNIYTIYDPTLSYIHV